MNAAPMDPAWSPGGEVRSTVGAQRPGPGEWRRFSRLLVYGLLVSLTMIGLVMPLGPADGFDSTIRVTIFMMIAWLPGSLLFAAMLWWITRGSAPWRKLSIALPLFAVSVAIYQRSIAIVVGSWLAGRSAVSIATTSANLLPIFIHVLWCCLTYGGVAAVIYLLTRHVDQTTATLHAIAIARERNEAAIDDEEMRAIVEQIEPRLLLDVMSAAQRQYDRCPAEAEETLRICTDFLRFAMPQRRSGRSTVDAELKVVDLYLRLRDRVDRRPVTWRIHRPVGSAIDRLLEQSPMPAMALLPVLERLVGREAGGGPVTIDLTVGAAAGSIEIRLSAPVVAPFVDAAWRRALDLRLACVCGSSASVRIEDGADAALRLLIVVPAHHS